MTSSSRPLYRNNRRICFFGLAYPSSCRRKPESSLIDPFRTPAGAGVAICKATIGTLCFSKAPKRPLGTRGCFLKPRLRTVSWFLLLGFTGLIVTMPARAGAESARSLTAKGNERYAAGDYGAALEAYEQAESNQPDSPEIQFNKGDAFFEQGDYQKARSAYEAAALRVKDLSLEAKSQFNMGNAALFEGQGLLANDSNKALEKYRQSVRHFKEALRINPEIKEAAENLELVRLRIKELQEQIKKQEEEKRAQQKQQEPQEKPDPSKNGEQAPQDAERQGQEPQDQSPPKQDSGRAAGEQQPKQGAPAAGQEKPEEGKGEHAEQAEGEKPQPAELTKEILREEKEHRLQRDRALRSEYQPVEKDW